MIKVLQNLTRRARLFLSTPGNSGRKKSKSGQDVEKVKGDLGELRFKTESTFGTTPAGPPIRSAVSYTVPDNPSPAPIPEKRIDPGNPTNERIIKIEQSPHYSMDFSGPQILDPQAVPRRTRRKPPEPAGLQDSGFDHPRTPKGEALATRITIRSPDWTSIGESKGSIGGIGPGEIESSLAQSRLSNFERDLVVWYHTEDASRRSSVFALLICRLVDQKIEENWSIRKTGILDNMANLAIENILYPTRFENMSDREYCRRLDISCNKDWPERWRSRYRGLIGYSSSVIDQGQKIIARKI